MGARLLPAGVQLETAILSFAIPGDRVLQTIAVAKLRTSRQYSHNYVHLSMGEGLLRVLFEPPLEIDLPAPVRDIAMQSVAYDFQTGAIEPRMWHDPGLGLRLGMDQAMDSAHTWMRDLVTGTAMAVRPYHPMTDADLVSTLMGLLDNLRAASAEVEVSRVAIEVKLSFTAPMEQTTPAGGVRIPAGGRVGVRVEFAGGMKDVEDEARRKIEQVVVESPGIVLFKGGEDQAAIKRLTIKRGGVLYVNDVAPLGPAAALGGVESLIRLFGVLSTGGGAVGVAKNIAPDAVTALVQREVEKALGSALVALVRDASGTAPGLDLGAMLDIA